MSQKKRLAAHERPIPARLPSAEREAWRKLPFDGPKNFRELGGYKTADGRRLKHGLIYRADKLSALSDDDLTYMRLLDIRTVVDFRSNEEREHEPNNIDELDSIVTELLTVDVKGAAVNLLREKIAASTASEEDVAQLLVNVNREFVLSFTPTFARLFELLLADQAGPLVFHCTAGKDRTGFAAALILRIMGVDEDTLMADYLATNSFTRAVMDEILESIDQRAFGQFNTTALRKLFGVESRYLQEAFDTIEKEYGDFEVYRKEGLMLNDSAVAELQARLLS